MQRLPTIRAISVAVKIDKSDVEHRGVLYNNTAVVQTWIDFEGDHDARWVLHPSVSSMRVIMPHVGANHFGVST
jgi:hypothetical protein